MKTIAKTCWQGLWCVSLCLFTSSCDSGIPEMPDHVLDVEFQYELTCADALLKYVTPEVTITDGTGSQYIISIESNMWEGVEHKTWKQSVRYDSLNVASTATVRYVPKVGITYHDESAFESFHNLSCLISIKEDGDGRRNNYTIIPETPSQKTTVKADELESFINKLSNASITRGGAVDMKGEITKIEIEK